MLGIRIGQNVRSLIVSFKNYNGSVYLIQGMQDWNVDPHMSFPVHQQVADAGIEIKTLAGQWAHDYPDRVEGHSSQGVGRGAEAYPYTLRWDWADEMLYWFDWYLKGEKAVHQHLVSKCKTIEVDGDLRRPILQWMLRILFLLAVISHQQVRPFHPQVP